MPHSSWFFSSKDKNSERDRLHSFRQRFMFNIFTRLFPQMTDKNTSNDNLRQDKEEKEEKEKEIRNSNITTATTITADSSITNEKNALIQVVEGESNKEANISSGLGNLSTTAYDFCNQSRRPSDISSEIIRPTEHVVNLSTMEPHDTVDISTLPSNNYTRQYRNPYFNTGSNSPIPQQPKGFFTRIKPTKETLAIIFLPLIIALIGVTIAIVVLLFVFDQEVKNYRDSFDYICMERISAVVSTFNSGLNTGRDFTGFFTVFASVYPNLMDDADEIVSNYGNLSAINNMNIYTMNFAPRIPFANRSDYEVKHGQIKQLNPQNQLVIRADAAEYFPVLYSIPWRYNTPIILNYDVSSEPESGLVIGIYEIDDTIRSVAKNFNDKPGIGFDIIDTESNTPIYSKNDSIIWHSANFNKQANYLIGDRNWQFTCYSSKEAYNRSVSIKLFKARYKFTEQAVKLGRTQSLLKAITADSKAVLEAIADPLFALNAKGEIVGANKHALTLTGYSPEEIKVANKMHINTLLIPVAETPTEERNNNPLNGDYQLIEVPVRPGMRDVLAKKKDGTLFEAEANFSQPVVEKNYFTQVVMFRDVSFKKENERAVMDAKRDADLANQSKTEFLFFLCHEIRNPIHAILGFAEMLKNSLKEKEQFEELEYIISAGKFLSFIVNDVLDLTHLTNPNPYEIDLKCDGFNIYTLVDNIAKIQSIQADHKQIQVKTIISGELPRNLYGDERRLEQILMKLLARSIEVAPSNGIVELIIEQKIVHHSKGILLRFSVKDQSKGLSSDEEINELFKPYAKTNSSIGSRFHAQGLSMALVQAIVRVMGGRLVVEKVDRSSSGSSKRKSNVNKKNNNHVWFEIWLLTEESKDRGRLLRESYDSLVISKNGSAGRNSFKISSAPGSIDGKMMDDIVINSDNEDAISHLRNRKSMPAKPKRDSKSYMNTIRKKRRSTTVPATSAVMNNGGEDPIDDEAGSIKNVAEQSKSAAANFFRKGSMMLASGLARAGSTIEKPSSSPLSTSFSNITANDDSIHRSAGKNIASSVQIESQESTLPLPIISYYSGGNTSISPGSPVPPVPPLTQDHNLLSSSNTNKAASIKSKNSSNISLIITNVNTSPNVSTSPHDTPASISPTSTGSLNQHSLHITLPNNNLPPLTSYDAHISPLTLTADAKNIGSITNNSNNDNDNKPSSTLDNQADTQVNAVANISNISAATEKPKKLRILLVEDNLVCQRVTYKMLNRNNYSVDIANHGKEAVDMVEAVQQQQQQQYACILMDIITPVMNGYEATQILRDRGVKIPILALTANSFESDVKKAKEVGMDDFLTKPIKEVELITAMKTQIEKFENTDSSQSQQDDFMAEHKDQYLTINS
ncbi:PAS domain S-box protein [Rhizophagus irregularis DAOM 181602=DAOM 197198]|nr:PAS domain S-box protein [Rhizophagus irregularis DAOM 181602=DAOM 197198]